jgi:hypothetical protein
MIRKTLYCIVPIIIFSFNYVYAAPAVNLDNAGAYPSPFNAREGHTFICFENLTDSVRLRVFKLTGELVIDKHIESSGGSFHWNVADENEDALPQGLYVYLLSDKNGNKKTGKIGVKR